jgi:hypothetical protein
MNRLKDHVILIFVCFTAVLIGFAIAGAIVFYTTFENSDKLAPRNIYKKRKCI